MVSRLLGRVLAVGAEPDDDEDTRLRKVLLLVLALAITPLALAWGALYWTVGATGAATIPWVYVGISVARSGTRPMYQKMIETVR